MKHSFYIVAHLLIIAGCTSRNDKPLPKDAELPCKPWQESHDTINGYSHGYSDTSYSSPTYNPNDENEFVFIRYIAHEPYETLWHYDARTKSVKQLVNQKVYPQPRWNKRNWILFANGNLWKIKDQGDSLIQLTFGGSNYWHPEWSPDGQKIICFKASSNGAYSIIMDEWGHVLETLNFAISGAWSPSSEQIGAGYGEKILIYNIASKEKTVWDVPGVFAQGMVWQDNFNLIICTEEGIFRLNTRTGTYEMLIKSCPDYASYFFPSISPARERLLVERRTTKIIPPNTLYFESKIRIIDLKTLKEADVPMN